MSLAHVVHRLKQQHGPRIVAHWLYHQARALTLEADRQAMAEAEQNEKLSARIGPAALLPVRPTRNPNHNTVSTRSAAW
jgi:hypothetical protein